MASNQTGIHRHRKLLTRVGLAFLLVVALAEAFLLYQERTISRTIRSQSASLLTKFLRGDTAQAAVAPGVAIRLQNVRFKWSSNVYVDAGNMAVRAIPIDGNTVDFDDLNSFLLKLQQSVVMISPNVLEGMMNESVFNYPDSKVRDLKIAMVDDENDHKTYVKLSGSVNMVFWIPFAMLTRMSVDQTTNTLVMEVRWLKVFGAIPATKILNLGPFHLDKMITLPPNQSLLVSGNKIMIKPFGLFPPPRITGSMQDVTMSHDGMRLTFSGNPIRAPESDARNYVYLRGGRAQFGNFVMTDTDVLIRDRDERNPFSFSVANYAQLLPRSVIDVHDTKSVRVTMPDS